MCSHNNDEAYQELISRIQKAVKTYQDTTKNNNNHIPTRSLSTILQEPQIYECIICREPIKPDHLFQVKSNSFLYYYDILCLKACYDRDRYKRDPVTAIPHSDEEVKAAYAFYEAVTKEKTKSVELLTCEYHIQDQFKNVLAAANYGTGRTTPTTYDEVNKEINFCLHIANGTLTQDDQFSPLGFQNPQDRINFIQFVRQSNEVQRIHLAKHRAQQQAILWTTRVFVGDGLISQATQRLLLGALSQQRQQQQQQHVPPPTVHHPR